MIKRVDSAALLVRSIGYGESDLIATFLTRDAGILACVVRGGKRSQKRFGGALEPIHELFVAIEDRGRELCTLKEARVERIRHGVTANLEAMEAAGQALRWARHLCAPRTEEAGVWRNLGDLLEALDARALGGEALFAREELATFGIRLLTEIGYALELDQCVRCGRPCPAGRSAFLDAAAGGLVCSSCGGARRVLRGEIRDRASRAQRGEPMTLTHAEAVDLITIVEDVMAVHSGFDNA